MSGSIAVSKKLQLKDLLEYKLQVLTLDGTVYVGILKGFDKYMNMTLLDCYELRITQKSIHNLKNSTNSDSSNTTEKSQPQHIHKEKRVLGFIILRGENILSTNIESTPLLNKRERLQEQKKLNKNFQKFEKKKENTSNGKGKSEGKTTKKAKNSNKKTKTVPPSGTNNKKRGPEDSNSGAGTKNKKQKTDSNINSSISAETAKKTPGKATKKLPPGFKKS